MPTYRLLSSRHANRRKHCADARGSVMALVSSAGAMVEQYRYSPTGVPNGLPLGDLDTDGEVKSATGQADDLLVKNTTYQVRKDLNLDGVRDSADETIVTNQNGKKTGRGRLSRESVGNRKSTCGNVADVHGFEFDAPQGPQGLQGQSTCVQWAPRALVPPTTPTASPLAAAGFGILPGAINDSTTLIHAYQSRVEGNWSYSRSGTSWRVEYTAIARRVGMFIFEGVPTAGSGLALANVNCTANATIACRANINAPSVREPYLAAVWWGAPMTATVSDKWVSGTNGTLSISHVSTLDAVGSPPLGMSIASTFEVKYTPTPFWGIGIGVGPVSFGVGWSGGVARAWLPAVWAQYWDCVCTQVQMPGGRIIQIRPDSPEDVAPTE